MNEVARRGVVALDVYGTLVDPAGMAHRLGANVDRKPDLADLFIDRTDIRVYRRNKREAIPILSPPEC